MLRADDGMTRSEKSRGNAAAASCPQCGQPASLTPSNRWRPFCSERCKLVDLGGWFDGRNRIPTQDPPDGEDLGQ